jgi:transcriptional regulator with XRE-family HTH domain
MIDYNIFRSNLKKARYLKEMTAVELSKAAKLRQAKRVSDIEDGRGHPTLDEVYSICHVLEQPIDFMLTREAKILITFT